MRCKICDWSKDSPGSVLRGGLPLDGPSTAPVGAREWDQESGTYQCTHCSPKPSVDPVGTLVEEWPIPDVELLEEDWDNDGYS